MKRPLLLFAALAACTLAFADPPAGGRIAMTRGVPPVERLAKDLGLDPAQTAAVKRIFDEQHARMEADLRAQLANVLTAEQLAKFDALPKRGPPGAPPGQQGDPDTQ